MARIISVIASKGGVGKTTATAHLAVGMAKKGQRVLLIDLDPTQANLTRTFLGPIWEENPTQKGIGRFICNGDVTLDEITVETGRENLWIVPSEKYDTNKNPLKIEGSLSNLGMEGYTIIRELFESSSDFDDKYDVVMIDNAPLTGISLISSLVASDFFIIPVNTSDYSMESIADTIKTAMKVKKNGNKLLEPLGFFISKMDNRGKIAKQSIEDLKILSEETGIHFFENKIPTSMKFDNLPRNKNVIFDVTKPSDKGHKEYMDLVKEIAKVINKIESAELNKKQNRVEV